ncbi:MAG: FecR family protein [Candidatus Margulisiibacteriota bacterium]
MKVLRSITLSFYILLAVAFTASGAAPAITMPIVPSADQLISIPKIPKTPNIASAAEVIKALPGKADRAQAEISFLKGTAHVLISPAEDWLNFTDKDKYSAVKLGLNDSVKTDGGSKLELKFLNGNTIRMIENSAIMIKEVEVDPKQTTQKTTIELLGGKIWNKVTAIALGKDQKNSYYQVSNPVAVALVKGTRFDMSFSGDESIVRVFEGIVEASNPSGKTLIPQSFFSVVREAEAPSHLQLLPPGSEDEWKWEDDDDDDKDDEGEGSGPSAILPAVGIIPMIVPYAHKDATEDAKAVEPEKGETVTAAPIAKPLTKLPPEDKKAPVWAAAQSFILPGSGEFYVKQPAKGLIYAAAEGLCIYMAWDAKTQSDQSYAQAKEARDNFNIPKMDALYKEALSAYQNNQTFSYLAFGIACFAAWDSYQEALNYNKNILQQGKVSFRVEQDGSLWAGYTKAF